MVFEVFDSGIFLFFLLSVGEGGKIWQVFFERLDLSRLKTH